MSRSLLDKFPNLLIFNCESEFIPVTSLCSVFSKTSVGTQIFFFSKSLKKLPSGPCLRLWYSSLWSFHSIIRLNFNLTLLSLMAMLKVELDYFGTHLIGNTRLRGSGLLWKSFEKLEGVAAHLALEYVVTIHTKNTIF